MGAGGSQTTTTESKLPPELSKFANQYLNALAGITMPGGQALTPGQSNLPYQEVAPLSPQQTQAMNLVSSETYGPATAGFTPQGAPPGGSGTNTGATASLSDLMQGIAGSPYYVQQFAQNPWMQRAFSQPALNQATALYAGLA